MAIMWKGVWVGQWPWQKRHMCGKPGGMGMKGDKNNKNLGVQDSRDRDKIQKETRNRFGGRRFLEMWSRAKGLRVLKVELFLDPSLWLPREQSPGGCKISEKRDLGKSQIALHAMESITLRTVSNGCKSRPYLIKRKSRETSSLVPITHIVWQPGFRIVLRRHKKNGKRTKWVQFYYTRDNTCAQKFY